MMSFKRLKMLDYTIFSYVIFPYIPAAINVFRICKGTFSSYKRNVT
jgi:hypothetical protein